MAKINADGVPTDISAPGETVTSADGTRYVIDDALAQPVDEPVERREETAEVTSSAGTPSKGSLNRRAKNSGSS